MWVKQVLMIAVLVSCSNPPKKADQKVVLKDTVVQKTKIPKRPVAKFHQLNMYNETYKLFINPKPSDPLSFRLVLIKREDTLIQNEVNMDTLLKLNETGTNIPKNRITNDFELTQLSYCCVRTNHLYFDVTVSHGETGNNLGIFLQMDYLKNIGEMEINSFR